MVLLVTDLLNLIEAPKYLILCGSMMLSLPMLIRAVKSSYSTATIAITVTCKNEPDPQLHLHLPQPGRDASAEVQRPGS